VLNPTPSTETREAEFGGLAGKKVAVVVYADEVIRYDYPAAPLDVSYALAAEMRKRLSGTSLVAPERVAKYQQENVYWDSMDKGKLGATLGADYVLYVTLVEFSTIEPGSLHLYRGRIACEIDVYEAGRTERDGHVFDGGDLRVVWPEEAPVGRPGLDDRQIIYATSRLLAEKLVRKFYSHEVPKEP